MCNLNYANHSFGADVRVSRVDEFRLPLAEGTKFTCFCFFSPQTPSHFSLKIKWR